MHFMLPGSLSLTLMQCINIIVKNVTKPLDAINVFNMEVNYDFPTTRLDLTQTLHSNFDHTPKPQFYIIGDLTQKQLDVTLYQFKDFQVNLFNPWAKILFVGSNFTRDFVGAVSRENIYNALFLNTVTGKIYTFFPYSGKRFISSPTLRLIGECDGDALNRNELFPPKYPDNWEGYELSVLMEKFELQTQCPDCEGPGIEIEILQLIANHLKMRSRFIFSNEILSATFYRQKEYDALIGDRRTLPLRSFEQTVSYLHDHLRWFVPSTRKMYGWFDNFFGLGIDSFIFSTFSIFIFVSFNLSVFFVFQVFPSEFNGISYSNGLHSILYSISIQHNYKYNTATLIFILSIAFQMFIVYTFSFAKLVDHFSENNAMFMEKIETTEDIAKYHLKVGSLTSIGKEYIFKSEGLEHYPNFLHVGIKQLETLFLDTTSEEKEGIAVLCLSRLGRYLSHKYLHPVTGSPYFKELRKDYIDDHSMAMFTKGNPVFLVVNRKLELLIDSGIINKIIGKYEKYISTRKNLNTIGKLNLKCIQIPSIILVIGLSVSLIVFLFELCF
ncbi:hypothetical protein WA026_016328 [Henosepilachna vigintioctopunctata]|uniref:Ionotropic receptor n=1 Tax=Henosepilachna vigintioctopunctata TaxID=420089 RepID=A0AAW1UCT6_9CUCU